MQRSQPSHVSGGASAPAGVRLRFAQAVRHVIRALTTGQPDRRRPAPLPATEEHVARLRARSALAEARAQMPSLVPVPATAEPAPPAEHVPGEAAGLRQALRAYTDRVDRLLAASDEERRSLRDQVDRLAGEMLALRAELAGMRAALAEGAPRREARWGTTGMEADADAGEPPPRTGVVPDGAQEIDAQLPAPAAADAAGEPQPPAAASPAGSVEHTRWDSRVFPAGTVGITLALRPVRDPQQAQLIAARLSTQPGLEHVELQPVESGQARYRVTFRQPTPWPVLRSAVEAASETTIDPAGVAMARGLVCLALGSGGEAAAAPGNAT